MTEICSGRSKSTRGSVQIVTANDVDAKRLLLHAFFRVRPLMAIFQNHINVLITAS